MFQDLSNYFSDYKTEPNPGATKTKVVIHSPMVLLLPSQQICNFALWLKLLKLHGSFLWPSKSVSEVKNTQSTLCLTLEEHINPSKQG